MHHLHVRHCLDQGYEDSAIFLHPELPTSMRRKLVGREGRRRGTGSEDLISKGATSASVAERLRASVLVMPLHLCA